eukprot:m.428022 g.428022  ORF g.428022 m.428022 type:complete len:96 (-) comp20230_c0_seq31:39-326(-)
MMVLLLVALGPADGYLHGEACRLLMKLEVYDDPRLMSSMIGLGKVMGIQSIEKYVQVLDDKLKYSAMLKEIYAKVNGKTVDDPDLVAFFKFKCWA